MALRDVRHNFRVNVTDGFFFGTGWGFVSDVTMIPLFMATLTDSKALIGLVASFHLLGWFLPQLFTADRVARLRRFKPMAVMMTLHERIPFFPLALVALLVPNVGREVALVLTVILLAWQGIGGGLTATAWQSMISKVIPPQQRGTFYGAQSAAANGMMGLTAVAAGAILVFLPSPVDFALCFLIGGIFLMISWLFIIQTREEPHTPAHTSRGTWRLFYLKLMLILRRDANFRWFLLARIVAAVASVGPTFYALHVIREFGVNEQTTGNLTGILLMGNMAGALVLGWLGDKIGHRRIFALGGVLAAAAALLAISAPTLALTTAVFVLGGIARAIFWTTALTLTAEYGTVEERPYYIGLANTGIAAPTLLAPMFGGFLADIAGGDFTGTFLLVTVGGIVTTLLMLFVVRDAAPVGGETLELTAQPAGAGGD